MKIQRIISVLLVFLLVASVSIPAVSADSFFSPVNEKPVCQFVVVNPVTVKLAFDGIVVIATSAVVMEIGNHLGKTWDETAENLQKFASDVGKNLNNLFSAKKWVDITSSEAQAVMKAEYECYTAPSGGGGKKDDKLYHKAKRDEETGKVKINTKRISEKDAVKELKEGRDIFTAKKELAENLVNRVSKENHKALKLKGRPKDLEDDKIEIHGTGKGYYEHYHPEYQNTRPHCWFWRR